MCIPVSVEESLGEIGNKGNKSAWSMLYLYLLFSFLRYGQNLMGGGVTYWGEI